MASQRELIEMREFAGPKSTISRWLGIRDEANTVNDWGEPVCDAETTAIVVHTPVGVPTASRAALLNDGLSATRKKS